MPQQLLLEQIALCAGAALSIALAVQLRPRRGSPASWAFFVMLVAISVRTLCQALALGLPVSALHVSLFQIMFASWDVMTGAFLVFALLYSGKRPWLRSPLVLALLAIEAVSVALIATNDWHGLLLPNLREVLLGGMPQNGPWVPVHDLGNIVSSIVGAGVLGGLATRVPSHYRARAAVFALSGSLPVAVAVAQAALPRGGWEFHLLPLVFPCIGLMLAITARGVWQLDILPVARDLLFTQMPDAVFVVDRHSNVADLNDEAARLLGATVDSVVGKPAREVARDHPALVAALESRQSAGEITLLRPEGERYFATRVAHVTAEGGDGSGAAVQLHDITDLKGAEMALRQANEELQTLTRLRDDLTSMIVHDLRTPLTSVITGLKTMRLAGELSEVQGEMLALALQGGDTLLRLINDLLDIGRMEAGALTLRRAQQDPHELLDQASRQVAALASAGELTVCLDNADGLPPLAADGELLGRALVNLLGNACKFTPPGGTVTAGVSLEPDGQAVRFRVTDSGIGIPEHLRERVFDKFCQVADRRAGKAPSTGLGLTFCKLAVEAHGGRIGVDSKVGEGSTFWFTVPVSPL